MSTTFVSAASSFKTFWKSIWLQKKEDNFSDPIKAKLWDLLEHKEFPHVKTPGYSYFPLNKFYASSCFFEEQEKHEGNLDQFLPLIDKNEISLIIHNGIFLGVLGLEPDLSSKVIIKPLSQAYKTFQTIIAAKNQQFLKNETDVFSLLNGVFNESGLFIYISPHVDVEKTINILRVYDHQAAQKNSFSKAMIFLGKESKLFCKETVLNLGNAKLHTINHSLELSLDSKSSFHLERFFDKECASWKFSSLRASLKKEASLESVSFFINNQTISRDRYFIELLEEGAKTSLQGGWSLNQEAQHASHIEIQHKAPGCFSLQKFKGIVKDSSRSSFFGKIFVDSIAQQTQAYQLNNNLVLSETAKVEVLPNLEIFADDVKASHGATIGQIDPVALFYLKTRGIEEKEAQKMLISGFCQEIIELFKDCELKSRFFKEF